MVKEDYPPEHTGGNKGDVSMDRFAASENLQRLDFSFMLGKLKITVLKFCAYYECGGWVIDRHAHSSYEFQYVASGSCILRTEEREFVVREGDFYLSVPHIYHEQANDNNIRYVEYALNCDIEGEADGSEAGLMLSIFNTVDGVPVRDTHGFRELFEEILEEAGRQQLGFYSKITGGIMQLLVAAARNFGQSGRIGYTVPKKVRDRDIRFNEITQFIEKNLHTNLQVSDLAQHFYLGNKQISRIIFRYTGVTAKKYINQLKRQKAKDLLKNTNLSISEIADQLGFSSDYYFNQFFKREEGYPPGIYRRNVQ